MRVIASLYDSRTASLFGSQCFSKPVPLDADLKEQTLRFDFDVFWCSYGMHTAQSMLLQFTMAAHDACGSLVNEFCVAWSEILFAQVRYSQRGSQTHWNVFTVRAYLAQAAVGAASASAGFLLIWRHRTRVPLVVRYKVWVAGPTHCCQLRTSWRCLQSPGARRDGAVQASGAGSLCASC